MLVFFNQVHHIQILATSEYNQQKSERQWSWGIWRCSAGVVGAEQSGSSLEAVEPHP